MTQPNYRWQPHPQTFGLCCCYSLGSRRASSLHCRFCKRSPGHLAQKKRFQPLHPRPSNWEWYLWRSPRIVGSLKMKSRICNLWSPLNRPWREQSVRWTYDIFSENEIITPNNCKVIITDEREGEVMGWFYLPSPRLDFICFSEQN